MPKAHITRFNVNKHDRVLKTRSMLNELHRITLRSESPPVKVRTQRFVEDEVFVPCEPYLVKKVNKKHSKQKYLKNKYKVIN